MPGGWGRVREARQGFLKGMILVLCLKERVRVRQGWRSVREGQCPREREKLEEVSGDDKRCDAVLSSSQVPERKVEGRSGRRR